MRSSARLLQGGFAEAAGEQAAAPKDLIQWIKIPGGKFTMGSGKDDETPAHVVTIKSFQMAKTLVTNKQYKACVDAGACNAPHYADGTCYVHDVKRWVQSGVADSFKGDDQPVVCVDWSQAKAFSEWVGGRLPSEAQWEYAARGAGKARKYPWGDEGASCDTAVISEGGPGCGKGSTWPVCSKIKGNTDQGLCDMAGNAWEWTQDTYHDSYAGAPADGGAWESESASRRVDRGGSWFFGADFASTAFRDRTDPDLRTCTVSFRPVR